MSRAEAQCSHRRQYYERNNYLICSYLYIDRLLDSSLPHNLIQEYIQPINPAVDLQDHLANKFVNRHDESDRSVDLLDQPQGTGYSTRVKVKRTPKDLYKVPNEETPLLSDSHGPKASELAAEEDAESGSPIVTVAIYINLAANAVLLIGKIVSLFTMSCWTFYCLDGQQSLGKQNFFNACTPKRRGVMLPRTDCLGLF